MDKKADLHVHSKYSKRPSEWVLRKIGCAESYTEPLTLYAILKQRGMTFVTITDHNTLAGSLAVAHLEDAFVSEEITTYFPDDGCKLHVLAYDITERHHEDISRLRQNVFDLVPYLQEQKIVHSLAHPLFSVNDRLTPDHFAKALLLFKHFELNGSRDACQNALLRDILANLTRKDIDLLAEKHNLAPLHPEPWKKSLTGGSDDHSSLNVARTFTKVKEAASVRDFLRAIDESRSEVEGKDSTPQTMAHNLYSIAYQFYKHKFNLDRYVGKDLLLRFLDRALITTSVQEKGMVNRMKGYIHQKAQNRRFRSGSLDIKELLQKEAQAILLTDPRINELMKEPGAQSEEIWFHFVNQVSAKVLKHFADSILDNLVGADLFDIFNTIGSAASLYTMLAPYFVAYTLFAKDRSFNTACRRLAQRQDRPGSRERLRVGHFTDTFHEVNGVAKTLRMQAEIALKVNKQLTIITCGPEADRPGVVNFAPIGTFSMPEYAEMKLFYPPLLKMLDYCYRQDFTHLHSATPGPVGLAALVIARALKLPIYGTYHTALPQYVRLLTEDTAMEDVMWRYALWYYNQMDAVFVPSEATRQELLARGLPGSKVRFYPRGIDVARFHPSKRNGFFRRLCGIQDGVLKILYVGRVSKEKNLPFLVKVVKEVSNRLPEARFVVVGDGPYLEEMKASLEGFPVTFTGYLEGDDLAQVYASSDLFVFPSATDTFGNVVLEAQASGIPTVVTDQGGPKENVIPGKTGIVVPAGDVEGFVGVVVALGNDRPRLKAMGEDARRYMENRTFESSYIQLWEIYRAADPHHAFLS
jgi:glycosyltransferase involved in cell wall biosynthesis